MITVRCLLQRSNPIYMPLPLGQRYSTNAPSSYRRLATRKSISRVDIFRTGIVRANAPTGDDGD